jgi:hypothetical protein
MAFHPEGGGPFIVNRNYRAAVLPKDIIGTGLCGTRINQLDKVIDAAALPGAAQVGIKGPATHLGGATITEMGTVVAVERCLGLHFFDGRITALPAISVLQPGHTIVIVTYPKFAADYGKLSLAGAKNIDLICGTPSFDDNSHRLTG